MVKRKVQFKKAYVDKDGLTHIPIKLKGKKKFKCDDCKKKVREIFTINPTEILLRRELCRACYCKTPESLDDLLKMIPEKIECNNEAWCKSYQPTSNNNETCNMIFNCVNFEFKNDNVVDWDKIKEKFGGSDL